MKRLVMNICLYLFEFVTAPNSTLWKRVSKAGIVIGSGFFFFFNGRYFAYTFAIFSLNSSAWVKNGREKNRLIFLRPFLHISAAFFSFFIWNKIKLNGDFVCSFELKTISRARSECQNKIRCTRCLYTYVQHQYTSHRLPGPLHEINITLL